MFARVLLLAGLLASSFAFAQQSALAAGEELKSVTYPVADLVIPIGDFGSAKVNGKESRPTLEANLVEAITRTIAPESWDVAGGRCTIKYQPDAMALIIKQTPANLERIADMLAVMRRFNALEVALEVRMLTVPESLLARVEGDCGIHLDWIQLPCSQPTCASEKGVAFVSGIEHARLTQAFETDRRTQVFCAPKITVFNGQAANLTVADQKFFLTKVSKQVAENGQVVDVPVQEPFGVGFKMNARPVVSADQRFISVAFDISNTELAPEVPLVPVELLIPRVGKGCEGSVAFKMYLQKPQLTTQHIASTVSIPDGGTAIICGPVKMATKHAKTDTSAIAKIPYMKRLFGEPFGYGEPSRMVLMVTPRIIINDENEQRPVMAKGKLPPAPTAEVQAAVYMAPCPLPQPMPAVPCRTANLVSDLLKAYDEACAAGHADEAERLARAALALDVTCFQKRK